MSRDRTVILLSILIFAALSVTCAITSEGFLEADGCTHYLYARWAFDYPVYFVDIWGRPFKTALYAPAAATVGLIGVRLTSLAVAVAIAMTTYAIARGQKYRWPALAVIFTFAQPLVFLHSFAELTELPFALLLGLGVLAYQRQRWWAVALLAGLLPLSRPEGFGFALLAAALLAWHRRGGWLIVLLAPVMAWQVAGAMLYNEPAEWWRWLARHWPYAGDSLYDRGSIFHFAALLPAAVGPVIFPFLLIGAWSSFQHGDTEGRSRVNLFTASHSYRIDVLVAAIPLAVLVGHSVLFAAGKMASSGELRYMLIVAPFWSLLAARGWEWIADFRWPISDCRWAGKVLRSPYAWAAVAAVLPAMVQFFYRTLPLVQTEDWKTTAAIARWYQNSGVAERYPNILAAHPGIFYYLDLPIIHPRVKEWGVANLMANPDGTILVLDDIYSNFNAARDKSLRGVNFNPWQHWAVDRSAPSLLDARSGLVRMVVMRSLRDVAGVPTPVRQAEHEIEYVPR